MVEILVGAVAGLLGVAVALYYRGDALSARDHLHSVEALKATEDKDLAALIEKSRRLEKVIADLQQELQTREKEELAIARPGDVRLILRRLLRRAQGDPPLAAVPDPPATH